MAKGWQRDYQGTMRGTRWVKVYLAPLGSAYVTKHWGNWRATLKVNGKPFLDSSGEHWLKALKFRTHLEACRWAEERIAEVEVKLRLGWRP